jgi:2-polyprenyl-6-methoxyphenol hydroxylase-like FAD-dependent oxidoreductase
MRALVVGAGIGGLTAALKLHARGIEVQVFESVDEIRPLSCRDSRVGTSASSIFRRCSARPSTSSNIQWSIAIPSIVGVFGA